MSETPKGLPTESAHPGERPSPSPPPPLPFLPAPLRAPRPPWCMVFKRVDGPCVMCQGIVNPFNLLSNVPEPCLPSCHLLTPSGRARSSFLAGRQVLQAARDMQATIWSPSHAEAATTVVIRKRLFLTMLWQCGMRACLRRPVNKRMAPGGRVRGSPPSGCRVQYVGGGAMG